jgi:hypothetical protein
LVLLAAGVFVLEPPTFSSTWVAGDVFVGTGDGINACYRVFDNNGVFKETVCDGLSNGDYGSGCSFNNPLTKSVSS